jgi:AcrR family transcriptional regulator
LEPKEYIISEADKLFSKYGFKSVTMDDIAKHLGMSKKTIYQHFSDKDELVNIVISAKIASHECTITEGFNNAKNAVEEVFFAITSMNETLNAMNARLFYDLQKYHPKAWLHFNTFKQNKLRETIANNLKRGVEEGFFRKDLNLEIITQMRLDQVDIIFNPSYQYDNSKHSLAQIMTEITTHFLYGVCSLEGLKYIDTYKNSTH